MPPQKELTNQRILVTRPKPQGDILCQKIREHGGEAIYFPTIEIKPVHHNLQQLNKCDWAIFVSPQAVYQIHALPPTLKVAAVGAGTAQALHDAHLPVHAYPHDEWSSEALLNLPELQNVSDKNIAIIKGVGGRDLLEKELSARGAHLIPIIVYERQLPTIKTDPYLDLLRSNAIDVIISTSNDGLQNLKLLLNPAWPQLQNTTLLVISERMQLYAKELGFHHLLLAKNASHDVILEALVKRKKYDK